MAGRGGVQRLEDGQKLWDGLGPSFGDLVVCFNGAEQWEVAREPMHATIDHTKVCGVGPGLIFAGHVMEDDTITFDKVENIALVPCAVGGTCIDEWAARVTPVQRTQRALHSLPDCRLRALLWYQGESDTDSEAKANAYGPKMRMLINSLRQDTSEAYLPVLQVAVTCRDMHSTQHLAAVRDAQLSLTMPNLWTVDARGLELQEDGLHLTTAAQKWLGRHLARTFVDGVQTMDPNLDIRKASLLQSLS